VIRTHHLASSVYLQLAKDLEEILVIRLIGNIVNVFEGNLAFLVYDEERSLANTVILSVGPEPPGHFAFRFEIAQEIVRKSSQTLGPRSIAGHAINGNAQNLGIIAFKAFEVGLVRGHLAGSDGRPGQRVKRQHYILFAAEVRELNLLPFFHIARQLEIRGHVSHFRHKEKSPFQNLFSWLM